MQTLTSSDLQTSSCQDLPCPREASPSTSKASSLEVQHVAASAVTVDVVALPPVVVADLVTEVAVAASLAVATVEVVEALVAVVATVEEVHPEADTEQTEMLTVLSCMRSTDKHFCYLRMQFNSTLLQTLPMICFQAKQDLTQTIFSTSQTFSFNLSLTHLIKIDH